MNIWGRVLKIAGWRVDITAPRRDKCVICVAPHTSNYDFILGLCAYRSLGRKANFLMKEFWFFFPMKYLLRGFGGIAVPPRRGASLTDAIIRKFNNSEYVNLAVTPEGTRGRVSDWRRGFLYIAYGAGVPVQLGIIDYKHKVIRINDEYPLTGDVTEDLNGIKRFYADCSDVAKHPEKFTV